MKNRLQIRDKINSLVQYSSGGAILKIDRLVVAHENGLKKGIF